jgi:hypothetical protein
MREYNGMFRSMCILKKLSSCGVQYFYSGFTEEYDSAQRDITVIILGIVRNHTERSIVRFEGKYYLLCVDVDTKFPVIIIMNKMRNHRELLQNHFAIFKRFTSVTQHIGYRPAELVRYYHQDFPIGYSAIGYTIPDDFYRSLNLSFHHDDTVVSNRHEDTVDFFTIYLNTFLLGIEYIDFIDENILCVKGIINRSLSDGFYILGYHASKLAQLLESSTVIEDIAYVLIVNGGFSVTELGSKLFLFLKTFFVVNHQLVMASIFEK